MPPLKASWTATTKIAARPSATARARSGDMRRLATGATIPSSTISSTSRPRGAGWSGRSRSTVSSAFACISAPAISSSSPVVEVGCTSWSDGADGPITTSLSLNIPRGVRPCTTCENGTALTVPGGPL